MDVADRISNRDDAEASRKQRVAQKNDIVFNALVETFKERISKYNERHPQGFGFPNAVLMSAGPIWGSSGTTSVQSELKVRKDTPPTSSLALNFPIKDGAMQVEITTTKTIQATIGLDILDNTPAYSLDGKRYSADGLADLLLEPVLSSTGSFSSGSPGSKFGFV
jgi:hypothetical protein